MLLKIISGGQTGVDRAALDTAIRLGIPHGGWLPRGRKAEDGRLPDHYALQALDTPDYRSRTERNVREADGTLIVSPNPLSGGSALTRRVAEHYGKPWYHIEPAAAGEFESARAVSAWIAERGIEVLNVAGPRASKAPTLYDYTARLLESVCYLDMMQDTAMPGGFTATPGAAGGVDQPRTAADAVARVLATLPLRERTAIAGTDSGVWRGLRAGMVDAVVRTFRLDRGNDALMADCRRIAADARMDAGGAAAVVLDAMYEELRRTHRLRRVK